MSDCIFCRIIKGEIPSRTVIEDEDLLAFEDINPQAPTHILIIPKQHYASLLEIPVENKDLLGKIFIKAREIAQQRGLDESGFRIVLNTGKDSGQDVFHIHFHVLGGRRMTWPPG
jgi:histidine triad (HIT) family protein